MEFTPSELLHKTMQLLQHRMQIPDLIRKEAIKDSTNWMTNVQVYESLQTESA